MKNLLLGNGINIQFGGVANNSEFIMKRLKCRSGLGFYDELFGNKLSRNELIDILNSFVKEANSIREGGYDKYVSEDDNSTMDALTDFKSRYQMTIVNVHNIMLEDWLFLVHMFFIKNIDLKENEQSVIQGFERIILDGIFNNGRIQEIYKEIQKYEKVNSYLRSFDNIFTLNYDNNIENLTGKDVFHLHGDFSVLANSENENYVLGYLRKKAGELVTCDKMKYCFCNALLNYSGKLKLEEINNNHDLIIKADSLANLDENDETFKLKVKKLKEEKPLEYQMIMTKISHPELNLATEYHFDRFCKSEGEMTIIGISPNNDAHIFNAIIENPNLSKVIFYYHKCADRKYIETNFSKDILHCEKVIKLWTELDCIQEAVNYNYKISSQAIEQISSVINSLSDDPIPSETILNKINQIPPYEIKRLCELVRLEMRKRNLPKKTSDEETFFRQTASISLIALQEGILPSVLFLICIMNYKEFR